MTAPTLLRGERAIGAYLGLAPGLVRHKHQVRSLPTMRIAGVMCATPAALDDWVTLMSDEPIASGPTVE